MVMSWAWAVLVVTSVVCAALTGRGAALSAAFLSGAQEGVTLAVSIAGSLCLWSGLGQVMAKLGVTEKLAILLRPLLNRVFPSTKEDPALSASLSTNICANFLGLGNAATPMGIDAARRLAQGCGGTASDELCRLVVLNTASIQLIPANVAAIRSGLGCNTPFDILPAVWLTSICAASAGLAVAWAWGRWSR